MENISRTSSHNSIPTLGAALSSPGASSSKPVSPSRTSSVDSFESQKNEVKSELPELPANINEKAPKANWRTSLESKINGGIAAFRAMASGIVAKLTQSYEAGKELLHEVGVFFGNLGNTMTGLARKPSPEAVPLPASAPNSPTVAPVDLGAPVSINKGSQPVRN